jgi:hypothetical protein
MVSETGTLLSACECHAVSAVLANHQVVKHGIPNEEGDEDQARFPLLGDHV